MKKKRMAPIVLLCICAAFLIAGTVIIIMPSIYAATSPVKLFGGISVSQEGGSYKFSGKIQNISDNEIILDDFDLAARGESGMTKTAGWFPGLSLTLAPGESFDLADALIPPSRAEDIVYFSVYVGGHERILQGSKLYSDTLAFSILMYAFGAVMGIIALALFLSGRRADRRAEAVLALADTLGGDLIIADGYFAPDGKSNKAALKTAASAAGAAVSAAIFGVGFYRTYSNGDAKDYIIGESKLYMLDRREKRVDSSTLTALDSGSYTAGSISRGKTDIVMSDREGKNAFIIKAKGAQAERIEKRLAAIFPIEQKQI